ALSSGSSAAVSAAPVATAGGTPARRAGALMPALAAATLALGVAGTALFLRSRLSPAPSPEPSAAAPETKPAPAAQPAPPAATTPPPAPRRPGPLSADAPSPPPPAGGRPPRSTASARPPAVRAPAKAAPTTKKTSGQDPMFGF